MSHCTPTLGELNDSLRSGANLLVAGLGDSLTQGWMVRRGFFDRFVDLLQSHFPRSEIERLNSGVPGGTATGGLARLGNVLDHSPQVVTVQFAINDMLSGEDTTGFSDILTAIAVETRSRGALPILATSCPVGWSAHAEQARQYYDIVRKVGREIEIPVANLDRYWVANSGDRRLYQGDGIHPTDEGHAIMAEGMFSLFG